MPMLQISRQTNCGRGLPILRFVVLGNVFIELKNLTFLEVMRIPFSNAGVAVERYFTEQPSAKEICVHFL